MRADSATACADCCCCETVFAGVLSLDSGLFVVEDDSVFVLS